MASKSVRQALAILAAACGAMKTIKDEQMVGAPHIVESVERAISLMDKALVCYPDVGATKRTMAKDEVWIVSRMMAWKNELEKIPRRWEYFVLVSIAYQAVVDLAGKVRDRAKLELIEPIIEPLRVISDFSDPAGVAVGAFECAGKTLGVLYREVGFEP